MAWVFSFMTHHAHRFRVMPQGLGLLGRALPHQAIALSQGLHQLAPRQRRGLRGACARCCEAGSASPELPGWRTRAQRVVHMSRGTLYIYDILFTYHLYLVGPTPLAKSFSDLMELEMFPRNPRI